MEFRLTLYDTDENDKYMAEHRYTVFGNRESIFMIWFSLKKIGKKHVEIYNLMGEQQKPENGISGLIGRNF